MNRSNSELDHSTKIKLVLKFFKKISRSVKNKNANYLDFETFGLYEAIRLSFFENTLRVCAS